MSSNCSLEWTWTPSERSRQGTSLWEQPVIMIGESTGSTRWWWWLLVWIWIYWMLQASFLPTALPDLGQRRNQLPSSGHVGFERCTHKLWHSLHSTTMTGHNDINQWYMHMLESVLEKHKILSVFEIQNRTQAGSSYRKHEKESLTDSRCHSICKWQYENLEVSEKPDKSWNMKVTVILIVIRALGMITQIIAGTGYLRTNRNHTGCLKPFEFLRKLLES